MFKTRRLNDPMPVPYCVQYGPRSGLRTAKDYTTVVDNSFLRPRPGYYFENSVALTPEWLEEQLNLIENFKG